MMNSSWGMPWWIPDQDPLNWWQKVAGSTLTYVLVLVIVEAVIIPSEAEPSPVPDGAGVVAAHSAGWLALLPQVPDQDGWIGIGSVVPLLGVRRRVHGQHVARPRHFQFQFVRACSQAPHFKFFFYINIIVIMEPPTAASLQFACHRIRIAFSPISGPSAR